jgi:hypothetical protein
MTKIAVVAATAKLSFRPLERPMAPIGNTVATFSKIKAATQATGLFSLKRQICLYVKYVASLYNYCRAIMQPYKLEFLK